MTSLKHCFFLLLLGCLLNLSAYSQTQQNEEKTSGSSRAASQAKIRAIRRELRHTKTDWAGEYYYGDGLGVNVSLSLAPENGFVFTWNGCLGLYDLNYGSVAFTNGTLKLQFKYPNNREGFEGIAPELLPVRWGGRHYLIAADRLIDFTNAINAGTEPSSLFGGRSGGFLLKRGDEEKPVSGQPTLPPQPMSYLLKEPIQASIARVDETRIEQTRRVTEVTINVGSTDGLKPGMELHVLKPSRVLDSALLTDVGEHSSRAIIEQGLSDPAPSVDWELSTKL